MCNNPDLSAIECRINLLQELLDGARLTGLDFENREHLHIVQLCLDLAIEHMKKIK